LAPPVQPTSINHVFLPLKIPSPWFLFALCLIDDRP
jgi:hypothetical protein